MGRRSSPMARADARGVGPAASDPLAGRAGRRAARKCLAGVSRRIVGHGPARRRGRDGPRRPAVPAGRMQGAGRAARSRSVRSGRAVQQRRDGPLCTDNERAAALLQQPRSFYRTLCGRGRPARFIPISGDLAIEAYIRPASPTWFSSIPFSVRRP